MRRCALPAAPPPLRVTGFFHVRRRPLRGESARSGRNTLGAKGAESPPHAAVWSAPCASIGVPAATPRPPRAKKWSGLPRPAAPPRVTGVLCAAPPAWGVRSVGAEHARRKGSGESTPRCGVCLTRVRQSEFPPPAPARRRLGGDL